MNKSYGLVYAVRGTIKGKRMVYLILENRYVYMDDNLASAAESMGIGMIGGPQKPPDHGKKISDSLKGRSKSTQHVANIRQSYINNPMNKGWKVYTDGDRNIHIRPGASVPNGFYPGSILTGISQPNKNVGRSYDEIHGCERADELRATRSRFLKEHNPGFKMKGRSYDELYGPDKANELRLNRSKVGKNNAKLYEIKVDDNVCFSGGRVEAENYLHSVYDGAKSNNLYNHRWLESKNIKVYIRYMNR